MDGSVWKWMNCVLCWNRELYLHSADVWCVCAYIYWSTCEVFFSLTPALAIMRNNYVDRKKVYQVNQRQIMPTLKITIWVSNIHSDLRSFLISNYYYYWQMEVIFFVIARKQIHAIESEREHDRLIFSLSINW
jgi:hypothetical protein